MGSRPRPRRNARRPIGGPRVAVPTMATSAFRIFERTEIEDLPGLGDDPAHVGGRPGGSRTVATNGRRSISPRPPRACLGRTNAGPRTRTGRRDRVRPSASSARPGRARAKNVEVRDGSPERQTGMVLSGATHRRRGPPSGRSTPCRAAPTSRCPARPAPAPRAPTRSRPSARASSGHAPPGARDPAPCSDVVPASLVPAEQEPSHTDARQISHDQLGPTRSVATGRCALLLAACRWCADAAGADDPGARGRRAGGGQRHVAARGDDPAVVDQGDHRPHRSRC